ncbi:hypothetical protein [Hymenobacter sp. IS2118]|uniref:hypothetical protein n=1 Tax=Hymenobacter sp. IS2118 TaxID=1505605 RepID=UPI0005550D58|nr:hypothetical protein [Hymenobacter sp. IS2118]
MCIRLFLPLAAAVLFAASSCKKDDPESSLPKATQEGKGTGGFLLDGKALVPKASSISTGRPVNGYWRKTRGGRSLDLSLRQFSVQEDWGVGFYLPDIRQPGTFLLNLAPTYLTPQFNPGYGQYYRSRPDPDRDAYTGPDAPGRLIITRFDTVNNIVSGTFEMSPREVSTNAGITITQGRFDLRFER